MDNKQSLGVSTGLQARRCDGAQIDNMSRPLFKGGHLLLAQCTGNPRNSSPRSRQVSALHLNVGHLTA